MMELNGTGKFITMNILTGYMSTHEGTVELEDIDILDKPKTVKKKVVLYL
ncbi:hypothetical protein [Clostridium thermarum]|nr:hypothetical protein [Clostridium thermarum]